MPLLHPAHWSFTDFTMEEPSLKIFRQTNDYSLATFGPILIQLWQVSVPLSGALEARRAARQLALVGYEATGSVVVVPAGSAVPEKDARVELTQIPSDLTNGAGLIMVQEGTGFKASAVRAVLSTMMLLTQRSMPHDVVSHVPGGAAWLSKRMKLPGGTTALISAVQQLRATYQNSSEYSQLAVG